MGDVAEAARLALERVEVTGPVNIGTGVETSVVTLFERLRAAAGGGATPSTRPRDPASSAEACWTPPVPDGSSAGRRG